MPLFSYGAAFIAGVLTVLSPCVLPILPIVFGSASAKGRFDSLALAAGVALSFTIVGLFIATVGYSLGFDEALFHRLSGGLLVAFGLVLVTPRLQVALETGLGPFSTWASGKAAGFEARGALGQAGLGALLGAVWSPCVGPTLGAASLLASEGRNLPMVAATMLIFGLGASAPLLAIGSASRATLQRWRGGLGGAGRWGKWLLGGGMLAAGVLAVSGLDKILEAILVDASPAWLTQLTSAI
jgi:cytochrome c biogenesis protein CcdA